MPTPGQIRVVLLCAGVVLLAIANALAGDIAILNNGFAIRHDHRIVMGEITRLYTSADDSSFTEVATADIASFEKDLTPPPPAPPLSFPSTAPSRAVVPPPPAVDLNQVVNSASDTYHLDPDLVNSVIRAESGFNAHAVSPKGARGLMQLMPPTANALGVNNAFNPQENVGGGSKYLRELLERYNFDLVKALAAYNAGPERVDRYNGVPPFRETRAYVTRIIKDYNRKVAAQEKAEAIKRKRAAAQTAKPVSGKPAVASVKTHKQLTSSTAHTTPGAQSGNTPR